MYIVMMFMRMMHISVILDPHYVGYIYDSLSLTRMHMHASMVQIFMTLDPDACMHDAVMNDAYIHDPSP